MDSLIVNRLESVANRMEKMLLKYEVAKLEPSPPDCPSEYIVTLDDAVGKNLDLFCKLSEQIGGDVGCLGEMMKDLFNAQKYLLWIACRRIKPEIAEPSVFVLDLSKKIQEFTAFKDNKKESEFYNHICGAEAAAGALFWVAQTKTPVPIVQDALDSALFYLNRVFTAHKGNNDAHYEWAKALKELLINLQEYVRKNHSTGLVWNSTSSDSPNSETSAPAPRTLQPSLPIPPPSVDLPKPISKAADVTALFESLNTGLAATNRLRKVTNEIQTRKNKIQGCNADPTMPKEIKPKPLTGKFEKKLEEVVFLDGKVWRAEYLMGSEDRVIEVTEKKHSVYIYKCTNSIIKIKGKANSITVDGCHKTSVVFDGLVAQCEVINSRSIQIQTLGELPTVSVQNTDGCHIYLSRESLNSQIVASKSSEMNVSAQLNERDDDYTEMSIPEQFVTQIVGDKLVTVASAIV